MKRSKQAKEGLKALLKETGTAKTQTDLLLALQSHNPKLKERHVSKALGKLTTRGLVEKRGQDLYRWVFSDESSSRSDGGSSENESASKPPLPIGELLRRRQASVIAPEQSGEVSTKDKTPVDIDEEIRRLEAELANDDDETNEESSRVDDSDGEEEDRLSSKKKVSFGKTSVHEIESIEETATQSTEEPSVLCLSTVADERIEPLPATCLPQNKRRKLKGIDQDDQTETQKKQKVGSGLEEAVKEVLSGYVARSSERLPFYCRVCAKQYKDQMEFFEHKSTEFHRKAVEMERKASYCKLCRKQFTSPVQLKEHVSSRPHKERLEMVKSSQYRGPNQDRKGRETRTQRQWC